MPNFIRTSTELAAVVRFGETRESLTLEFKENYAGRLIPKGEPNRDQNRREGAKEVARDVAQFANTEGGCLLIGVAEGSSPPDGEAVAGAICPIVEVDGLRQWIEDAIVEFLVPSTLSREICPIAVDGGTILSVNVPASRSLVSVWDRRSHAIEYLYRTNHGKAWMNPDEMERHLMNGSRAAYLTLSNLLDGAEFKEAKVVDGLWVEMQGKQSQTKPSAYISLSRVTPESFTLRVPVGGPVYPIQLPHGVVEHAWRDDDGKISLILSVRLVVPAGGGSLDVRPIR